MRKPVGFEGSASPWHDAILGPDIELDDPSFQTAAAIARETHVSVFTVRRWIANHPKQVECRVVRRAGIRVPVRVYKLKGGP